ncbi:MAG: hypothetical protein H6993_15075 [Pseudomonadales bacterium]|nr:hypothetical protein [Pseudomonadales bacterium]MCP5185285.1 hypothetical protein [Pseudomonadales bacterium]
MTDDYDAVLSAREVAALRATDALIGIPAPLQPDVARQLSDLFSPEELTELILGVGLFHGMSKVLIALGLEPESMPTTVVPTPGA